MGELGELLHTAREEKGLSLSEAEQATRIRSSYLQAIEDEDFAQLPHPAYIRGFVRNYATFLGVDPDQALALFHLPQATEDVPAATFVDQPLHPAQPVWGRLLFAAALVIIVGTAAVLAYQQYGGMLWPDRVPATATATAAAGAAPAEPTRTPLPTAEPTAAPSPTPTRTRTSTPKPLPASTLMVSTEIVGQPAWMQVWVDGEQVMARTLQPGTTNSWAARQRITVRSGNAGAVRVTVNDQVVGTMGEMGQIAEREWTAPGVPTSTPSPG
jgi:cytoskeletal protein RodZ